MSVLSYGVPVLDISIQRGSAQRSASSIDSLKIKEKRRRGQEYLNELKVPFS